MIAYFPGSEVIIEGQLYPTSGNIRTLITVKGMPDGIGDSTVRVECVVHDHIVSLTDNGDGSFTVGTSDGGSIPVAIVPAAA